MIKHKNLFSRIRACPGCELKTHKTRSKSYQVIGRGDVPADLLFIGEAPGKSEDMIGEPFVGPAGNLLEAMIKEASGMAGIYERLSYYVTNTVLCRPWIWDECDELYGQNRKPKEEEVLACMPNVLEIARIVNPILVVFVGKVSEQYYAKEFSHTTSLYHPAFHLRYGGRSSPYYRTDMRILSDALKEIYK